MKCKQCGINDLGTADGDGLCTQCRNEPIPQPGGFLGWVCPVCGRGNSPYSSFCPCMGWPEYKVTCDIGSITLAYRQT